MATESNILPKDPAEAVKFMTKIVRQLLDVMEQEGRALTMADGVSFTAAQEDKTRLSRQYEQATEEFKRRVLEFRGVDKGLLDRLDKTQRELKARTEENSAVLARMKA